MMKQYLLFGIMMYCFQLPAYSQLQATDSLQTVFETHGNDSIRLQACKQLTSELAKLDSAKAELFIQKGIALSQKLTDTESSLFFESERARILTERGHIKEANSLIELILVQANKEKNQSVFINCLKIQAIQHINQGDINKLSKKFQELLAISKSNENQHKTAHYLSQLGIINVELGKLNEALDYLNESLTLMEGLKNEHGAAESIRCLGVVFFTQGHFDKALQYYKNSLEIEKRINNQEGIASCLYEISIVYQNIDEYKLSISYAEKSIKIHQQTGNTVYAILSTAQIGRSYMLIGQYNQAIAYMNDAIKQAKAINNTSLVTDFYVDLGSMYLRQGNFNKGILYYKKNLDSIKAKGNKSKYLNLLNHIGYAYKTRGKIDSAFTYYRRSLQDSDSSSIINQSYALINIGFCHLEYLNNEDSAFYYLDQAIEINLKLNNNKLQRNVLRKIGSWYTSQGQIPKALKFYSAALKIVEETEDSLGIANIYGDLAYVYKIQQNWDEAVAYHKKALQIYDLTYDISASSKTKIALAELYVDKNDYQQAINLASQAHKNFQELQDSCQFSKSNLVLGSAFSSLQQPDSAIYYLKKSSSQAQKCKYYITAAQSYIELGKIYSASNQPNKSFNFYVSALEYAGKSQDRKSIQEAAAYLFPVYQQKGQYQQAFETLNLYQANKDSLFNEENTRNLVQKEMEYAYAKTEQEKELVRQQAEALEAQKLQRQTLFTYMFVGGFIAMLLIALAFYRNYRNKQKANVILTKQKEELEELDHVKSRLFANLSHELRTPLTLISSPMQALINDRAAHTKATMEKLELVDRNSKQLRWLVDDILDLSKLESNKIELHEEKVVIAPLLRRVFSNFSSLAEHLSIKYTMQQKGLADEWILLDEVKVEKVLNNLLSNAIKHTPSGGEVTMSAHQAGGRLVIHVDDTGQGIAQADLPLIFDRFFQSRQPDAPIQGGSGIGLALAKELTNLMKGRLSVESELGKGSQFSLDLPYQVAELPVSIELPPAEVEEQVSLEHLEQNVLPDSEKHFKVLIVEDHPDMQQFVKGLLEMKYHVSLANNGKEALEVLQKEHIDLVVSDVMMPELDGYELLKRLKESKDFNRVPVIMLTALDDEENKLNALTLGVDDYLAKPFSPEELLARTHNLLLRHEVRLEVRPEARVEARVEARQNVGKLKKVKPHNGSSKGILLLDETDEYNDTENQSDVEWLHQVAKVIRKELENPHFQTADLAFQFNSSIRNFYRRIKKSTGLSPKKYQQEVALLHARDLLQKKALGNVTAISYAIGMSNVSRFSQLYEARFGKKPKEYFCS